MLNKEEWNALAFLVFLQSRDALLFACQCLRGCLDTITPSFYDVWQASVRLPTIDDSELLQVF